MGRPERDVDADSGPLARFACDLRALRKAAGSPSYRSLAAKANYSATMLSRAASGRELASLPVVLAYVSACGGDCDEWRARWLGLVERLDGPQAELPASEDRTDEADTDAQTAAGTGSGIPAPSMAGPAGSGLPGHAGLAARLARLARLPLSRRAMVALSVVVAVLAAGAAAVALTGSRSPAPQARQPGARQAGLARSPATTELVPVTLSDGNDPKESGCGPDAVTAAQADLRLDRTVTIAGVLRRAGTDVGLIELRYSAHCHAAWARATPMPAFNVPSLGWVTIRISRPADGTYASFRVGVLTTVYGDILLTNGGCLSASADFQFRGGGSASATTPCWRGHPTG
ncbi:MAG TPA: DUF2690 domain-containing protein [Streptosporangiaceae bacterium]|nr:DUF2690 domain-containing protein [Streptosporangiaceae bacterium]